jgi:hypothetical protein
LVAFRHAEHQQDEGSYEAKYHANDAKVFYNC